MKLLLVGSGPDNNHNCRERRRERGEGLVLERGGASVRGAGEMWTYSGDGIIIYIQLPQLLTAL